MLKKENEFIWDNAVRGKALEKLKMILSKAPVLQYFDVNKELTLQCDSSQSGLGVVLQGYNFDLKYRPGSEIIIADTLSRAYPEDSEHPSIFCEEIASLDTEQEIENKMVAAPETLVKIRQAAEQDKVYSEAN